MTLKENNLSKSNHCSSAFVMGLRVYRNWISVGGRQLKIDKERLKKNRNLTRQKEISNFTTGRYKNRLSFIVQKLMYYRFSLKFLTFSHLSLMRKAAAKKSVDIVSLFLKRSALSWELLLFLYMRAFRLVNSSWFKMMNVIILCWIDLSRKSRKWVSVTEFIMTYSSNSQMLFMFSLFNWR